jgi:hypothetical protein
MCACILSRFGNWVFSVSACIDVPVRSVWCACACVIWSDMLLYSRVFVCMRLCACVFVYVVVLGLLSVCVFLCDLISFMCLGLVCFCVFECVCLGICVLRIKCLACDYFCVKISWDFKYLCSILHVFICVCLLLFWCKLFVCVCVSLCLHWSCVLEVMCAIWFTWAPTLCNCFFITCAPVFF